MNTSDILVRAIEIARTAHQGQLDKTGQPYFGHCQRVAQDVGTAEEKVVAYLHDVVEKTRAWSFERLEKEGFPSPIVRAVRSLTRAPGEDEEHFVCRAMADPLARSVKLADLHDNLVQVMQVGGDTSKLTRSLDIARRAAAAA